jgi:hypothetical protein
MFVTNPGNTRIKVYSITIPLTGAPTVTGIVPGVDGKRPVIYAGYWQSTSAASVIAVQATSSPSSSDPTVDMMIGITQLEALQPLHVPSPLIGYVGGSLQFFIESGGTGNLYANVAVGYIDGPEGVDPTAGVTP